MAKLNWQRVAQQSKVESSDYWNNPKSGFDGKWHKTQAKIKKQKLAAARRKAVAMIKANKLKNTTT